MCKIKVRFEQSPESCNVFEYALKAEVVSAEGITPKIFVYHQSPKGLDGNSFAEFDHVATPVDLQEIPADAASDTVPWYRTNRVTVWLRNASDLETAKKLLVNDISWLQKAYNHLSSENDFTLQDTICFHGDGEHGHPSKEEEDSMSKRIDKIEEELMNKIDKDVMNGVDISANTPDGMRESVEKIGNVLGATIRSFAAFLCLSCLTAYGAEVYKAEFNTLDLDYRPSVVTNVTFDGLASTNDLSYSMAAAGISTSGSAANYSVGLSDRTINLLSSSGLSPSYSGGEYELSFRMNFPNAMQGRSRDFFVRFEMVWMPAGWYRVKCLFPEGLTIEHDKGEIDVWSPRMQGKPSVTMWHFTEVKENVFVVSSKRMVDTSCPMLAHRWSFNGNYLDSVTGESPLSFFGNSFGIVNNELVLSGNGWGSGGVILDKGTLGTGDATVEIWATQNAVKNNSLIFDYSNFDLFENTQYEAYLQWTSGTDINKDRMLLMSGGKVRYSKAGLGSGGFAIGVKYYIAMTFHDLGDGTTSVRVVKIRSSDHSVVFDGTATVPYWTINSLTRYGATFALGLYKNSSASDANASYDEVRVWHTALSQAAILKSEIDGPDADVGCLNATLKLSGSNSVNGGYEYLQ